jgi:hypothetical protein
MRRRWPQRSGSFDDSTSPERSTMRKATTSLVAREDCTRALSCSASSVQRPIASAGSRRSATRRAARATTSGSLATRDASVMCSPIHTSMPLTTVPSSASRLALRASASDDRTPEYAQMPSPIRSAPSRTVAAFRHVSVSIRPAIRLGIAPADASGSPAPMSGAGSRIVEDRSGRVSLIDARAPLVLPTSSLLRKCDPIRALCTTEVDQNAPSGVSLVRATFACGPSSVSRQRSGRSRGPP